MKTRKNMLFTIISVAVTALYSCGGGTGTADNDTSAAPRQQSTPITETQEESADVSPKDLNAKGVGPITDFKPGPLDEALVKKGGKLFMAKCAMCHKMDTKLLGPPLNGVTDRRSPEWVLNMLLAPDKMIAEDPAAKALYAKYNTPMINQQLSKEEAKAIYDYLRKP